MVLSGGHLFNIVLCIDVFYFEAVLTAFVLIIVVLANTFLSLCSLGWFAVGFVVLLC